MPCSDCIHSKHIWKAGFPAQNIDGSKPDLYECAIKSDWQSEWVPGNHVCDEYDKITKE